MITVNEDLIMPIRFISLHCYSPVDPATMELAPSARAHDRTCPVCDETVALAIAPGLTGASAQTTLEHAA